MVVRTRSPSLSSLHYIIAPGQAAKLHPMSLDISITSIGLKIYQIIIILVFPLRQIIPSVGRSISRGTISPITPWFQWLCVCQIVKRQRGSLACLVRIAYTSRFGRLLHFTSLTICSGSYTSKAVHEIWIYKPSTMPSHI